MARRRAFDGSGPGEWCHPMRSPLVLASVNDVALPAPGPVAQAIIFYGTISLLLFSPLAFGATEPWSIFFMQLGAAVLFAGWTVTSAISEEPRVSGNALFVPMLCFAGLIAFQILASRS